MSDTLSVPLLVQVVLFSEKDLTNKLCWARNRVVVVLISSPKSPKLHPRASEISCAAVSQSVFLKPIIRTLYHVYKLLKRQAPELTTHYKFKKILSKITTYVIIFFAISL
jgi:hypothetical protein